MQRQISQGLRDHYGPLAIGLACDDPEDTSRVQLSGHVTVTAKFFWGACRT